MTEKDMTLKVKATFYPNDEDYPWKATCSVYPNLEGKGDTPEEALEELVLQIEKLYTRGKFAIKNDRPVEVGYTMTSVSAEISLAVSKNKSLSEFGLEIARQEQCERPNNGRPCQEFAFKDGFEEPEKEE